MHTTETVRSIQRLLLLFIICLFISGLTAIPVEMELRWVQQFIPANGIIAAWLQKVYLAYTQTSDQYPFLFYGYDWLAFAHFVLAILFVGPYRDPIRNIWVIQFGMIACVLVIPFAFIAGYVRGIPIGWRLIDCSFGVFGFVMLQFILNRIRKIEPLITKIYRR